MAPLLLLLAPLLQCAAATEVRARALRPPLLVQGRHIVDATGQGAYLACVNWYGAYLEQMVVNGLNRQPLKRVAALVRELGFNCVRLPFSLDMIFGNYSRVPNPNVSLAANPALQHLTPLAIFDATVSALTDNGVAVILNNHVSSNQWCCTLTDGEGLWYTEAYSQDTWFHAMGFMAARYRGNSLVVGFDLRNEIRPSMLGTPTWGSGDNDSDWSIAAVQGAKEVLAANEDMLIIISGLYFSIFLCDVPRNPVHELVPELRNRTVYTSHEYKWVNFHMVTRTVVGSYVAILGLFWAGLSLLVTCGWKLSCRRCCDRHCPLAAPCCKPQGRGRLSCCGRRRRCCCLQRCCCRRMQRPCEFLCALALTAVAIVLMVITEFVMDKCSLARLVVSMALLFLAFACFGVSLVLWMRLTVFCVRESQAGMDWPSDTAESLDPGEQELARRHLEVSAAAPSPRRSGAFRAVARSKRCCLISISGLMVGALALIWFWCGTYGAYASELDSRWGFLMEGGQSAPVWIGEFGSSTEDLWWSHVLQYFRQKRVAGWAYWSLNGEKMSNSSESFGLLMEDSITVRHPWKLEGLRRLIRDGEAALAAPDGPPLLQEE